MKDKQISVVHLFYMIIIALILMSFLLVIAFGGSKNANAMMGTASTVSSLILSVIAIVMTIVDLAGQRNTVSDLKETADKLETNLITVNEGIKDINSLKEAMLSTMSQTQESNRLIMQGISDLKEKYINDGDEPTENTDSKNIVADLDYLSEITKKASLNSYLNHSVGSGKTYTMMKYFEGLQDNQSDYEKNLTISIKNFLINNFEIGKKYKFDDFFVIFDHYDISRARLKKELEKLNNQGFILRDNNYYIIKAN